MPRRFRSRLTDSHNPEPDLPCIRKKLASRLHDSWSVDEEEDSSLCGSYKRKSRSNASPFKSLFLNYELEDLEEEAEKIKKEADELERQLRHVIAKGKNLSGLDRKFLALRSLRTFD